ncbi:hypothetical protein MINTM018_52710 (plasmid) [Mycobacterium intracellulare]|uniref:Uncharacterized protein n=1 Tax=Mycobacterium intracellulare TaxID=1767 RepID=A0A7R7N1K5_MYCIT|nr:hypothetical protein MINTM018_52710 [Mycobacterium intracellulare]
MGMGGLAVWARLPRAGPPGWVQACRLGVGTRVGHPRPPYMMTGRLCACPILYGFGSRYALVRGLNGLDGPDRCPQEAPADPGETPYTQ